MKPTVYPFAPKSTAFLERGQFWAIPLRDGSFGAGCVLGFHYPPANFPNGTRSSRVFIAGVLGWHESEPPTANALFGKIVVEHAFAHIKVVTAAGGLILGKAHLKLSGLPDAAPALALHAWGFRVPEILAHKFAGMPSNPANNAFKGRRAQRARP
jgi:hypothetical protein